MVSCCQLYLYNLVTMAEIKDCCILENLIKKAHKICSKICLSEAIELDEDEVRLFLYCNHVANHTLQDEYLGLVKKYDDMISGEKPFN